MQKKLLFKMLLIMGITLILLIPLAMIEGVINDRQHYQYKAVDSIRKSWTGSQSIIGPVLVIPYEKMTHQSSWKNANRVSKVTQHKLLIAPEKLTINGQVNTEERQRSIYKIPVYTSDLTIEGDFNNQKLLDSIKENSTNPGIVFKKPYLSMLISDPRGIVKQPKLEWNGQKLKLLSGSKLQEKVSGIHVMLDIYNTQIADTEYKDYKFKLNLKLRGMEKISFSPIGAETTVNIKSPWLHPSFTGNYLPVKHHIGAQGFTANWQTSSFSSNTAPELRRCAAGKCQQLLNDVFAVSFVQPVDSYLQSERSVKYGILFLTLTFVVFFLYEVMRKLAVHPIQYLLVGLALSMFFLLLVSLSEIVSFGIAYGISAIACTALLGSYVSGVLDNGRAGTVFSAMLGLLYAILFIIISSEDNALLMGSLLLFIVLGTVMIFTRRIDWYNLDKTV